MWLSANYHGQSTSLTKSVAHIQKVALALFSANLKRKIFFYSFLKKKTHTKYPFQPLPFVWTINLNEVDKEVDEGYKSYS